MPKLDSDSSDVLKLSNAPSSLRQSKSPLLFDLPQGSTFFSPQVCKGIGGCFVPFAVWLFRVATFVTGVNLLGILKVRVAKDTATAGQCIGNPIHQRHCDGASTGIPPGAIQTTIRNPKMLFLPEAGNVA